MGIQKILVGGKELFDDYSNEFEQIFKMKLKIYLDMSSIGGIAAGFDLIKFNRDIRTPDGMPCEDYVAATYGKRAEEIIRNLL